LKRQIPKNTIMAGLAATNCTKVTGIGFGTELKNPSLGAGLDK
jgi:hypothetical protein